jgi:hypothetical protein
VYKLKITSEEFLIAIKGLTPGRLSKSSRLGKVDIGFLEGSVIFSTAGSKTRCVAVEANWPGYASIDKAVLVSFLTIKPTSTYVDIVYDASKIQIERLIVPAIWAETPEWITEMSTEARLFEGPDDLYAEIRNCGTRSNCLNLWGLLTETPDPKIRRCSRCDAHVHLCLSPRELEKAISSDKRVAITIKKRTPRRSPR